MNSQLKVQDDYNLDKEVSDEGGAKTNKFDMRRSSGSFPPTKYQITLDQKVEAPSILAGPGNVPFITNVNHENKKPIDRGQQMLLDQLSPEKLVQLIKEQQHKYPELNALTPD